MMGKVIAVTLFVLGINAAAAIYILWSAKDGGQDDKTDFDGREG